MEKISRFITIVLMLFVVNGFAGTVTLNVADHNGSALAGVAVSYNDYGSHYVTLGTTDAGGQVVADVPEGTWNFKANKNYSDQIVSGTSPGTINFQTAEFVIHVEHTNGSDFEAINTSYNDYGSHWLSMGTTDASGLAKIELFPGNYQFKASKDYSDQTGFLDNSTAGTSQTIDFQAATFEVHVTNSGGADFEGINVSYNDYGSHWLSMGTTDGSGVANIELFPGNFQFQASKNYSQQSGSLENSVSGTTQTIDFQTATFVVHVTNSGGADFEDINVSYNDYGSHWLSMGTTDADGLASIELFPGNFQFKASKNYTMETGFLEILDSGTSSTINFQTALATGIVKNCDTGDPIEGINVSFNDYGSHWLFVGNSDVNGMASIELFEGNGYQFRASTIYTSEEKSMDLVSAGTSVEFNPTQVCFNYGGTVKYNDYGSHWMTINCGTYMFPGTYQFKFDDYQTSIEISGCTMTNTAVVVKLIDSNGDGLEGGTAKYYKSGWHTIGTTPANGTLFTLIDGTLGNLTFKMFYGGASQQKSQNVSVDGTVVFQTTLVTMKLLDTGDNELAGTSKYYASGWKTFGSGTTTTTMEMLPVNYTFKVYYGGSSQQKSQNVGNDPLVVFNTVVVTMKLLKSDNTTELVGDAKYYASGWKTFGSGSTTTTMEMLPGNYTFKVYYGGASQQKSQNVSTDPIVIFSTVNVTMKLLASNGTTELAGDGQYYANGWKDFGSGPTTTTMELLPVNYTFKVYYGGASQQKSQNVGTDPIVIFNTVNVTMKLLASNGTTELAGDGQYYASGWKDFGSGPTTTTMELLPVNYTFKINYGGASQQKNQNVGSDPTVIFNTVLVTMKLLDADGGELAGEGQYYASGWKDFGTTTATKELLPVSYTFKVSFGGSSMQKNQNVNIDPVVIFTGTAITLHFTGDIMYYASGWKTFAKPTMNLLPGNYTFKFYNDDNPAIQQSVTVEGSEMEKTVAYVRLIDHSGNGLSGGTAKYYLSGWKDIPGTTNSHGAVLALIDGNLGNTLFKMNYVGASKDKSQNLGSDSFVIFQTELVTFDLFESDGTTTLNGSSSYYANGWKTFGSGTTPTTMELLPVNYTFKVGYGGATKEKGQNVASDQNVVFQTVEVSFDLLASDNAILNGSTHYYASGWKTFGSGTSPTTMELLPVNYSFKVGYGGATKEKGQNVNSDPDVEFSTVNVSFDLYESNGTSPLTGNTSYYASGWKTFGSGSTPTSMEMLPVNYTFKVGYGGATKEKGQNVSTNQVVVFNTALATVTLNQEGSGDPLSGGDVTYYASGWKTFGTTDGSGQVQKELLPVNYSFNMVYSGVSKQKSATIASPGTTVPFEWDGSILKQSGITPEYTTMLNNVYPNPFNVTTTVEFAVEKEQKVIVAVIDINGRVVKTLVDRTLSAGEYKVNWRSDDVIGGHIKQGVYFIKMITSDKVDQKTVVKMR